MKRSTTKLLSVFFLGFICGSIALVWSQARNTPAVQVTPLLRDDTQLAENLEVIAAIVEIPKGSSLPRHYHPGEEYIYVLEGSAILRQDGKDDVEMAQGAMAKIPIEQIHTAVVEKENAKALVIWLHPKGQPIRVNVDE